MIPCNFKRSDLTHGINLVITFSHVVSKKFKYLTTTYSNFVILGVALML